MYTHLCIHDKRTLLNVLGIPKCFAGPNNFGISTRRLDTSRVVMNHNGVTEIMNMFHKLKHFHWPFLVTEGWVEFIQELCIIIFWVTYYSLKCFFILRNKQCQYHADACNRMWYNLFPNLHVRTVIDAMSNIFSFLGRRQKQQNHMAPGTVTCAIKSKI